jgi:hypothetical protein
MHQAPPAETSIEVKAEELVDLLRSKGLRRTNECNFPAKLRRNIFHLLGLWEGLVSLPPPSDPPFDIEKNRESGGVLDAGESRSPQGEPARWCGRIKPSSPSNLLGRPSVPGFQPTTTNPQPTRPNSGTKPPAQAEKHRKSISETAALPSSNTPDDKGNRLEATRKNHPKTHCQKI